MIREVRFEVKDELARLWFIYKKKLGVESKWPVEVEITNTGLLLKGKSEEVRIGFLQEIAHVVAYFAQQQTKYCYRVLNSESDFLKLTETGVEFQYCQIDTLKKAAQLRSHQPLSLSVEGERLIVFNKKFQNEFKAVLSQYCSEAIPLTDRHLICLIGAKAMEICKKKFSCEMKLMPCGTAVINGPKQNVSQCVEFIRHALNDLIYKVVLSRTDDSFSEDSRKKIIEELEYCKNIFWLTEEKFKKRLEGQNCTRANKILDTLVESQGAFLLVICRLRDIQFVEKVVSDSVPRIYSTLLSKQQTKNCSRKNGQYSAGSTNHRVENEAIEVEQQVFERDFQPHRRREQPEYEQNYNSQQNYAGDFVRAPVESQRPRTIPDRIRRLLETRGNISKIKMHGLVLQGIKKFSNFRKKFDDLEKAYGIRFCTSSVDKQGYLQFTTNSNQYKVLEDLEFFFQDLPIITYRLECGGESVNVERLNPAVQYELRNNPLFSQIVVGHVCIEKSRARVQVFYSRNNRIQYDKEELEKLIKSKMYETKVRLVKISQEEILPQVPKGPQAFCR